MICGGMVFRIGHHASGLALLVCLAALPGLAAEPQPKPEVPAAAFKVPRGVERSRIQSWIKTYSARYRLDPFLIQALMEVESGWDVLAVSPKGAQGLMQIMPGTGRDLALGDPFDPAANIEAGCRYLGQQLKTFGDVQPALAAYNAGPEAVRRFGGIPPFPETQRYVTAVVSRFVKLKTGRDMQEFLRRAGEGQTPPSRAYP